MYNKKEKKSVETLDFKRPDNGKLLFEIIDLNQPDREIPETYHRHDFFEIVIILKGSTKHFVDFKAYTVTRNEILLIPQNCIHQGGFRENITGYLLLFTKDFFTSEQYNYIYGLEIFNVSYGDNLIRLNEREWDEMYQLLLSLIQEYDFQKKSLNNNTLRFLLLAFNTKLNTLVNDSNKPLLNSPTIVKPFFELLENNFAKEHSVAFYISQLNITAKKLAQALSQATGKTTLDLITERIVLEAKRELLFSKKSIKEIAFYLGFDDQLYFSKYIKKNTGRTPQHLRKDFAEISI